MKILGSLQSLSISKEKKGEKKGSKTIHIRHVRSRFCFYNKEVFIFIFYRFLCYVNLSL